MILHIDMDAFFASVEQRDRPELKGKCVIVGRDSGRGVVAAASYEARKFGVRSAMPIFQAKKLCPQAVFVTPRIKRYAEVSRRIMGILSDFSPLVEAVSIDEAFVDVAGCERLHGSPDRIARMIKNRIRQDMGLSCSIGIAPNKFLAKIASDLNKPDGLYVLPTEKVEEFIKALPIEKVPGVGAQTGQVLAALSIVYLGDVRRYRESFLVERLGKFGRRLFSLSSGVDSSRVTPHAPTKSISSEHTLSRDAEDKTALKAYLKSQAEEVGRQLRKETLRARTVTLKLKDSDFKQITRSMTLPVPTQSSETIYKAASSLLEAYDLGKRIRLVGVGASGLVPGETPVQQSLFDGPTRRDATWEKIDKTMDNITSKFGPDSIHKGG